LSVTGGSSPVLAGSTMNSSAQVMARVAQRVATVAKLWTRISALQAASNVPYRSTT